MSKDRLVVLLNGAEIGEVERDRNGRLSFAYREQWRAFEGAIPLSLSMPIASSVHGHKKIEPFLWGMLPDNERVLERWGERFQVSPRNAFALIAHTGEDCPGAVQFIRPDRLPELQRDRGIHAEWLTEHEVAQRLRRLQEDPAAGRLERDEGQFSLAGAQAKTALLFHEGRWGVPSRRTPTTHILKPPMPRFDGHTENEHLCLALLRALGLRAAQSEVTRFEDMIAIVVQRFDRYPTTALASSAAAEAAALAATAAAASSPEEAAAAAARSVQATARASAMGELARTQPILRLHQEDLCQALSRPPSAKYQSDGGPGPIEIVELLRASSTGADEDEEMFVDALIFNWLIAGTDAHVKNYALLLARAGQVRLAPLYDVASALPYDEMDVERLKLAMKVGDKYRLRHIGAREWAALARAIGWESDRLLRRASDLALRLPDAVRDVWTRERKKGLKHPILDRLETKLVSRARECSKALG